MTGLLNPGAGEQNDLYRAQMHKLESELWTNPTNNHIYSTRGKVGVCLWARRLEEQDGADQERKTNV